MPGSEVTCINFKVIALTHPGFGLQMFGFPDLPKLEMDALLIWPSRLVTALGDKAASTMP